MDLQAEYRAVCAAYFPRWRAAAQWTVLPGPRTQVRYGEELLTSDEAGLCEPALKTIWVTPAPALEQRVTLIHEICHAVCPRTCHGRPWQRRMRQAAARAAARGEADLQAELLQSLVDTVAEEAAKPRLTVEAVKAEVADMLMGYPEADLSWVVDCLALTHRAEPQQMADACPWLPAWMATVREYLLVEEVCAAIVRMIPEAP